MLITDKTQCGLTERQGSRGVDLAELRRQLANPSTMSEECRQRLSYLAKRLAEVRVCGNECAQVAFSEYAESAMDGMMVST